MDISPVTQKKKKKNATARRPLLDVWQALVDLCTESGRQQADSIIVSFFSADSPTGMFKQLPTDVPAQQALLSSVDRQLPAEAQQACEGPDEGIPLAELHSALKASARGKKPGSDDLPYEFFFFFFFFFFGFFFFFCVTGEMSIPFRQAAVKDARRT
ncbi:hypothetical protein ABBQ32_012579 [Trebouxia sp. C0010 RCD-2024]